MKDLESIYFFKSAKLPTGVLTVVSILCFIGFASLYSAAGGNLHPWAYRQILVFCVFFPLSLALALVDIRIIYKSSYFFYAAVLCALVAVELFGTKAMGGKRWVNLGFMVLQPSEPAKIGVVLALAKYFSRVRPEDISKISTIFPALLIIAVPAALIIKEPDLGTGIITLISCSLLLFAAGVSIYYFLAAALSVPVAAPLIWPLLKTYQKKRILVFLDPEKDSLNSGYNIIQSKISIGSGGFFGKGFIKGSQSKLDFLPEHQTDFIFASFSEEFGFLGGTLLIILYSYLIIYCVKSAAGARSIFARLTITGIGAVFFSHIFVNIGMATGILPVVGVPLPFVSHGGTMLASALLGFGLIMNSGINYNKWLN